MTSSSLYCTDVMYKCGLNRKKHFGMYLYNIILIKQRAVHCILNFVPSSIQLGIFSALVGDFFYSFLIGLNSFAHFLYKLGRQKKRIMHLLEERSKHWKLKNVQN